MQICSSSSSVTQQPKISITKATTQPHFHRPSNSNRRSVTASEKNNNIIPTNNNNSSKNSSSVGWHGHRKLLVPKNNNSMASAAPYSRRSIFISIGNIPASEYCPLGLHGFPAAAAPFRAGSARERSRTRVTSHLVNP